MIGGDNAVAQGTYIGTTAQELTSRTGADKIAGGVSQQALFPRGGEVGVYLDRLVLGNWSDAGDLVLHRTRSARPGSGTPTSMDGSSADCSTLASH
jgi:hypothetical protein